MEIKLNLSTQWSLIGPSGKTPEVELSDWEFSGGGGAGRGDAGRGRSDLIGLPINICD